MPWASVLYACDGKWWRSEDGIKAREEFHGLKVTQDPQADELGLHRVIHSDGVNKILTDPPGTIGAGGNSGFHALNLAVQFGARRIILLGYDMSTENGIHWHGPHKGNIGDPQPSTVNGWVKHYEDNAGLIKSLGVEVINCSPGTALTCFQKRDIREVMENLHTA